VNALRRATAAIPGQVVKSDRRPPRDRRKSARPAPHGFGMVGGTTTRVPAPCLAPKAGELPFLRSIDSRLGLKGLV